MRHTLMIALATMAVLVWDTTCSIRSRLPRVPAPMPSQIVRNPRSSSSGAYPIRAWSPDDGFNQAP
ncbi:hypothetical protein EB74_02480 [Mycobacterium sp. SWH-M5]|nr:hypothetical protein EB74_02480 [Mycobacterium sp. SWH-M5]